MRPPYRVVVLLGLPLLLCACGGGSNPPPSYTIAGSVTGLTAISGLVLQNNGDALSVPVGATSFTFTSKVVSGNAYDVTVQSQPSGENCTVNGGSGTASADVSTVSVTCNSVFAGSSANVVTLTVDQGLNESSLHYFNIPSVTVKVCAPGSNTNCATIDHVLVDTGSYGLRLFKSALNGMTLPPEPDLTSPPNDYFECFPFADGYSWGEVDLADVSIGGESTVGAIIGGIPVEVIDSSSPVPTGCANSYTGNALNTTGAFDANGILGLGVLAYDCGPYCTDAITPATLYYSCPSSGCASNASPSNIPLSAQVPNPVIDFPTDNNGVIVQLPYLPGGVATGATGYLAFGIGTQINNSLGAEMVLTTDGDAQITTIYKGTTLSNSFIDSGSTLLFFGDSTLALCGQSAPWSDYFCPSSPVTLTATNQGTNGNQSNPSFQVANFVGNSADDTDFASAIVAGPAPTIQGLPSYFDWGLPFFYGRTLYSAINGRSAGNATGPYFAY